VTQIPACKHERTRLIAKDNEAEYIECVDCGAILETHELAEAPKTDDSKSNPPEPAKSNPPARPEPGTPNPFDESLSDA
jgi:Zn ribbon nucleic-acid-binding protein